MRGRGDLVDWYRRNRRQSRALFDLLDPAAYYSRPIALRNPIVFYEGHLPAFSLISLVKRGLGRSGVENAERLELLFARGIDPESEAAAVPRSGASTVWPSRDEVIAFGERADALVVDALLHGAFDLEGRVHPAMKGGEAIYTALEHEAMHQETLLYMWHRLPHTQKQKPVDVTYELQAAPPTARRVTVPAGTATLGADRDKAAFGWDNEFDAHQVHVPAFDVDAHSVTNADFLAFVEARAYQDRSLWSDEGWEWVQRDGVRGPAFWSTRADGGARSGQEWLWRGMFENLPLPLAWPVYVSQAEASAYARWKGRRLLTEAEYHRAAFGSPDGTERRFPWGDEAPDPSRGNFDFQSWEPVPAGSRPAGASAWGVHDLVGNGWEWTATVFTPFDGFAPMPSYPEYSSDFFDGLHYVMKGASPATAQALIRRSFRNWFRANYPYVYAKFLYGRESRVTPITTSFATSFASDVARDLLLQPKQLQSKYLYDALGSSLFDAICRLPWYRITRAERRLLKRHAADVVEHAAFGAQHSQARPTIVELGCGSGEKLALVAEALQARGGSARVHLIDISSQALEETERRLTRWQHISIVGHQSTYEEGLRRAALARDAGSPVLVLFLGSNIGNFDTPAAGAFLRRIRRVLEPGDLMLLGADLLKPESELVLAYDDPLGVTAAFNKNLLVRINRELEGDFDLSAFKHRAVWDGAGQRIEMHLVSQRQQVVAINAARVRVSFARDEWIWTESSYKYSEHQIADMGTAAGFGVVEQWVDAPARFALTLFRAV